MTSSPISWIVRVDRRKAPREDIVEELKSLAASIQALGLEIVADEAFWDAPDAGTFRDFVPLARISHPSVEALEVVAEELLLTFGWLVDFKRHDDAESEEEP